MHAMKDFHRGVDLLIDQSTLVHTPYRQRHLHINQAMERAVRKQMDKNSMICIPYDSFVHLCDDASIQHHDSPFFFTFKDRTDPNDAGRLIIDYKQSGINSATSNPNFVMANTKTHLLSVFLRKH